MISTATSALQRLLASLTPDNGQALTEYGLILALVALACVIALGALGLVLAGELDTIAAAFP